MFTERPEVVRVVGFCTQVLATVGNTATPNAEVGIWFNHFPNTALILIPLLPGAAYFYRFERHLP